MTKTTATLMEALAEVRERLLNEGETRKKIAARHRMARRGFRGEYKGREWNEALRVNHAAKVFRASSEADDHSNFGLM